MEEAKKNGTEIQFKMLESRESRRRKKKQKGQFLYSKLNVIAKQIACGWRMKCVHQIQDAFNYV